MARLVAFDTWPGIVPSNPLHSASVVDVSRALERPVLACEHAFETISTALALFTPLALPRTG